MDAGAELLDCLIESLMQTEHGVTAGTTKHALVVLCACSFTFTCAIVLIVGVLDLIIIVVRVVVAWIK